MKRVIKITLLVIWISFIFFNSLQQGKVSSNRSREVTEVVVNVLESVKIKPEINRVSFWVRKLAHVFEYFVLTILLFITFQEFKFDFLYRKTVIIGFFVAMIDETIQLFVPGRSGQIIDLWIDTIGISLAMLLIMLINLLKLKKKRNYA